MNKLFTVSMLLLISVQAMAQQKEKEVEETYPKVYFRAGAGYAIPNGGHVQGGAYSFNTTSLLPLNGTLNISSLPTNTYRSYNLKKVSYTAGMMGTLAFGLNFNEHLGAEVVANVGLLTKEARTELESIQTQTTYDITTTQHAEGSLFLTPSLVVQTGGKINVYARAGVTLPVITKMMQTLGYNESTLNPANNQYVNSNVTLSETYSMYFTPGFAGAAGIKFSVSNSLQLWAEAGVLSLNLYYKESELTSYTQDGVSYFNQIPSASKKTSYVFEGTTGANGGPQATTQVPFSNFNISVGVAVDIL